MGIVDIVILVLLLIGAVSGLTRGFFKELATIGGLIVGLIVARVLYVSLAELLAPYLNTSMMLVQVLSFIVIWLAVPLGLSVLASVLTKAVNALYLGWVNRLAGIVLGVVKFALVIGLVFWVLDTLDTENRLIGKARKERSLFYYPLKEAVGTIFFPMIEEIWQAGEEEIKDSKEKYI